MRNAFLYLVLTCASVHANDLDKPERIQVDGKPLDVTGGHAAPCVVDVGGKPELLVGQFLGESSNPFAAPMRVYPRGRGTSLAAFRYLVASGAHATIPSG